MASSSSSPSTSPSRATFVASPAVAGHATLIEFLHNVPAPLTAVLISLSSPIARVRWLLEVVSWKRAYSESWLTLACWWAVCLLSGFVLRYMLVIVAAAVYWYAAYSKHSRRNKPPVTEESLQAVVVDLSVIESSIPSPERPPLPSWPVLIRVVAILYVPSTILTTAVRPKVLVGVIGTIVLTWRAPWARNLRAAVMRSAWVRWALYQIWSRITGQSYERKNLVSITSQAAQPNNSIRFLFTVLENQRWWMGLDWTSALLPSERPSWCSATHESLSPPSAFALPPSTVTFLSDGQGGMLKRTAIWTWDEGEWKVVVKKENAGSRRVEKELPIPKEETAPSQSKMDKTKLKLKETGQRLSPTKHDGEDVEVENFDELHDGVVSDDEGGDDADEPLTDNDGWVYGDNQWKATSNRGGLGKYTRFRRWTRIALLTETIEPASAEEALAYASQQSTALKPPSLSSPTPGSSPGLDQQTRSSQDSEASEQLDEIPKSTRSVDDVGLRESESSSLRSRLKAAIRKSTI